VRASVESPVRVVISLSCALLDGGNSGCILWSLYSPH